MDRFKDVYTIMKWAVAVALGLALAMGIFLGRFIWG